VLGTKAISAACALSSDATRPRTRSTSARRRGQAESASVVASSSAVNILARERAGSGLIAA
jgi:hypothetical protein